jgi:hypothetical protein
MKTNEIVLTLLLSLSACDALHDGDGKGEPLLTVRGQITPAPDLPPITENIRLAIAWSQPLQPMSSDGPPPIGGAPPPAIDPGYCSGSQSVAITSQELEYQASFPINFTFDITSPPPAAVLVDDPVQGKGAWGVVMAYADGNGNGKLDACPSGQPCADRILGATTWARPASSSSTPSGGFRVRSSR